jgi:hypothetical protein
VLLTDWIPALAEELAGKDYSPNWDMITHLKAQQAAKRLGIKWGMELPPADVQRIREELKGKPVATPVEIGSYVTMPGNHAEWIVELLRTNKDGLPVAHLVNRQHAHEGRRVMKRLDSVPVSSLTVTGKQGS